jgi:predicted nucleotidyltransferase
VKSRIQEITEKTRNIGIPLLIIGGYAVMAHGYVRTTEDLDLIVPRERRADADKLFRDLGMTVHNDAATFLQFNPRNESEMKVDVMFVSEEVFGQLERTSMETSLEGIHVRVVSLLHLIALKCHSFQNSNSIRRLKDLDDLIQLILINQLDLNKPELRAIILKHGNAEIYEKLRHACSDQ